MSVVALKVYEDRIEMSADSITVQGDTKEGKYTKMYSIGSIVFGSSGYLRESEMFRIFCQTHSPSNSSVEGILDFFNEFESWLGKRYNIKELTNSYLLIHKKNAFLFDSYCCLNIKDFDAIGAGYKFARTALYLDKTTKEACEIACKLSVYCEPPVITIIVDK